MEFVKDTSATRICPKCKSTDVYVEDDILHCKQCNSKYQLFKFDSNGEQSK